MGGDSVNGRPGQVCTGIFGHKPLLLAVRRNVQEGLQMLMLIRFLFTGDGHCAEGHFGKTVGEEAAPVSSADVRGAD